MQPKILFTDIYDVDFNVLLKLDIDSFDELMHLKQAVNIMDNNFWTEKFKHDNIPIITKKTNSQSWIEEYKKIRTLVDLANKILIINDIEMNAKEFDTDGWISVSDISTKSEIYKDVCKNIVPNKTLNHLENLDPSVEFIINIGVNQRDKDVNIFVYNAETDDQYEFTHTLTYEEMHNFIVKALYYNLRITDDGFDDGLEFIMPNKDFKVYGYANEQYYAYKRYGYWEMLNTFDKHTIQFLLNNVKSKYICKD